MLYCCQGYCWSFSNKHSLAIACSDSSPRYFMELCRPRIPRSIREQTIQNKNLFHCYHAEDKHEYKTHECRKKNRHWPVTIPSIFRYRQGDTTSSSRQLRLFKTLGRLARKWSAAFEIPDLRYRLRWNQMNGWIDQRTYPSAFDR